MGSVQTIVFIRLHVQSIQRIPGRSISKYKANAGGVLDYGTKVQNININESFQYILHIPFSNRYNLSPFLSVFFLLGHQNLFLK